MILVGTERGLYEVPGLRGPNAVTDPRGPNAMTGLRGPNAMTGEARLTFDGRVLGLDGRLALVEGNRLRRADGSLVPLPDPEATCLLAVADAVFVGTREAHLLHLSGGTVTPVEGFERAEGRDRWYTPWGGPPDTRSLSAASDGMLYANVHVGGILRSDDAGATWVPTIDVDADVHEVLALDGGGTVVAATAYGLARSDDQGSTWKFSTEGLHAAYCRAVTVAGDWLLVSASTGPSTRRAAIYRRPLAAPSDAPFERCRSGLPEWFVGNVNTGCLAGGGDTVVLGTTEGVVYLSDDGGATWAELAGGLPPVTSVALVSA